MNNEQVDRSTDVAQDSGAFAEKIAGAANPTRSTLGRVTEAAAAVKLGARVLPAAWRLFVRYPVRASVVVFTLASLAYLMRPPAQTGRRGRLA